LEKKTLFPGKGGGTLPLVLVEKKEGCLSSHALWKKKRRGKKGKKKRKKNPFHGEGKLRRQVQKKRKTCFAEGGGV